MEPLISSFDQVFINYNVENTKLIQHIENLFPTNKITWVNERPFPEKDGELSGIEYSQSKRWLYFCHHKGSFFKRCPGFKKGLACCNYYVLNLGLQCHMDCSYCYLQSYLNTPVTVVYTNIDDAIDELDAMACENPNISCRIGTGETIDSLGIDPITQHSEKLMNFFYRHSNWYLELKTKTTHIDHLLDLPHNKNIIMSWSLNPQDIIDKEEHGTASLEDRFHAARKCVSKGFPVAFYLDPLIWHKKWKQNYLNLIDELTSRFQPEEVIQLAMGALRFQPEQRHIMRERFGLNSLVTSAEVFPSQTGKMRYDSRLRNEMFQTIIDHLEAKGPNWKISLCMETAHSWKTTYNSLPAKIPDLKPFFQPVNLKKPREERLPSSPEM